MKYHVTFFSFNIKDREEASIINKRFKMAIEINVHPNTDCSTKVRVHSEADWIDHFEEYAVFDHSDLAIFNSTSNKGGKYNLTTKGFVKQIIRDKSGKPVIGVNDIKTGVFDTSFQTIVG